MFSCALCFYIFAGRHYWEAIPTYGRGDRRYRRKHFGFLERFCRPKSTFLYFNWIGIWIGMDWNTTGIQFCKQDFESSFALWCAVLEWPNVLFHLHPNMNSMIDFSEHLRTTCSWHPSSSLRPHFPVRKANANTLRRACAMRYSSGFET